MSDTPQQCAVGHIVRGRHLHGCDDDTCGGCYPALAAPHSRCCHKHEEATREALNAAPKLITHLRTLIPPGARNVGEKLGKTKADAAPAPLNVTAHADADDLHALLAHWASRIVTDHPANLTGPNWAGSAIRPKSTRRIWGERVYEDARIIGLNHLHPDSATATHRIAQWITPHLPWAFQQDWAPTLATELPELVNRLHARWPIEEHRTHLPQACGKCERLTLAYGPPRFGGNPAVHCTRCGFVEGQDLIPWQARLADDLKNKAAQIIR